jgi:tRNA (cmo5U34)-methyltransferase
MKLAQSLGGLLMAEHDTGYAPKQWIFDEEVTRVFGDMLGRSIPNYLEMRRLVKALGTSYAERGVVLDIGCSLGEAMMPYVDIAKEMVGYEISEPMQLQARDRFIKDAHVAVLQHDVTEGIKVPSANLVLGVLTMMFIPTDRRHHVIYDIYQHTAPGGAFLMVDKIIGETSMVDNMMVKEYYALKAEHGYTPEDIERKRLSLQGSLVPFTAHMNEEMLKRAGFSVVECFWRWMNFAGWIAIK